jgi:hypothetical protein
MTEETDNPQAEADMQDQPEASTDAATDVGTMGGSDTPTNDSRENDEPRSDPRDDSSQPQANAAPGQAPMTAGQPNLTPDQQAAQQQQQAAVQQFNAQRAGEIDQHDHQMGLFKRAGQFLAGGPAVSYKMDPETGQMVKTAKPLTGGQIAMGIVASVLGGMSAGKGARNPVEAIGQGFNAGAQQYKEQDEAKQKEAKDEYDRGVQAVYTNFKTMQVKQAAMKLGWDTKQEMINNAAPLYKAVQKADASGLFAKKIMKMELTGSDFQTEMQKDPNFLKKYVVIPIDQEYDVDPKTGQPHTNHHGDPAINSRYAVLDRDAIVEVPQGLLKDAKGKAINYPEGFKLRMQAIVDNIESQEANTVGHHANAQFGEGAKEKDTTSPTAKAKSEAKTGAVEATSDTTASDEKAAIWKRYPSIDALADVMSKNEGQAPGSRAQRNNNPGNIKGKGDNGTDKDGFAVYSTPEVGKKAQVDLLKNIQAKYPDLTAQELINGRQGGYAGYSSAKDPGNSQASVDSYVAAINKGATGATSTAGAPATAVATTTPPGLKFATPSNAEWDALPDSAKKAFMNLGGHWDDFINNGADAVKSKRISDGDYEALANMLHSADGKLKGRAALDQNKKLIETTNKVNEQTALEPGKVKLAADEAKARESAKASGQTWGNASENDPQKYIASLTPGQAGKLKGIYEGRMAPERLSYWMSKHPEEVEAMGKAYPDFDITAAHNYADVTKKFTSGKTSDQLVNGSTALKHLREYKAIYDANPNEVHIYGTEAYQASRNKLDTIAGELAAFYNLPKTDKSMKDMTSTLGAFVNRDAAIREQVKSMGDRLMGFQKEWKNAAPSPNYQRAMPGIDDNAERSWKYLDTDGYGKYKEQKDAMAAHANRTSVASGELPSGNGQKLNPSEPGHKEAFEAYMKAAGDDPVKAKQMMQDAKWVF